MKTNKNHFFVHNIFAIHNQEEPVFVCFYLFFFVFSSSAEGVILTSNSR